MPDLISPTVELRESFLAAMDEYLAEGRGATAMLASAVEDQRGSKLRFWIRDSGPGASRPA